MAAADELLDLQNSFGIEAKALLKIMENQGDFHYIITIWPYEECPVRVQLSLYHGYPDVSPEIFVKSCPGAQGEEVRADDRERLRLVLVAAAGSLRGRPVMKLLVLETLAWIKSQNYHGQASVTETQNLEKVQVAFANETKSLASTAEEVEKQPRKKLRTAEDVISRLLWDENLDRSCFTVGYMDRFAGLVEEKFNAFCWDQPLSAVDNDTLAIPQHRIQYFKYKQVKVWDKTERLDLFFGSSGSNMDIYSTIKEFEAAIDKAGDKIHGFSPDKPPDLDDCDIDFTDESKDSTAATKVYANMNRPNFFVAVRVNSHVIQEKVQEVTEHIVAMEPIFNICCLPPNCMHITLATLRLNDISEISHAVGVLRSMRVELRGAFPDDIRLEVEKLDTFYQNVLYARIKDNPKFVDFADFVRKKLEKSRVKIVDNHSFIPHMTLMKITRPIQRQFTHSRRIDPSLYQKFKNLTFGDEVVKTIYLCPVGVDRREDGFYQTVMEMDF